MTSICPDCGAEHAPNAAVCPRCGFPLRPEVLATRGNAASSRSNAAGLVIGLVVGGFFVVMMIGVFAAIAIPRFARATRQAKEQEGVEMLRQIFTLEQSYRAEYGDYTTDLGRLARVGYQQAEGRHYFPAVALAAGEDLCVQAVPRPGEEVSPLSMDENGRMFHDPRCVDDPEAPYNPFDEPERTRAPGPGGEAGARLLLRQVHDGIQEYHGKHGRWPHDPSDLLTRVHASRAAEEYMVMVAENRRSGICVYAQPRQSDDLRSYSVNQDGDFFAGSTCEGTVLTRFVADSAGRRDD